MNLEASPTKLLERENARNVGIKDTGMTALSSNQPTETSMKTEKWTTRPISPTCEVLRGKSGLSGVCGDPTSYAYPAHGGGWMSLCDRHGQKHLPQINTEFDEWNALSEQEREKRIKWSLR